MDKPRSNVEWLFLNHSHSSFEYIIVPFIITAMSKVSMAFDGQLSIPSSCRLYADHCSALRISLRPSRMICCKAVCAYHVGQYLRWRHPNITRQHHLFHFTSISNIQTSSNIRSITSYWRYTEGGLLKCWIYHYFLILFEVSVQMRWSLSASKCSQGDVMCKDGQRATMRCMRCRGWSESTLVGSGKSPPG